MSACDVIVFVRRPITNLSNICYVSDLQIFIIK